MRICTLHVVKGFGQGPEFGSDEGSIMIVVRALYGLKSSGAAFRSMLADHLYEIGYKPSRGDPDVWLRPGIATGRKAVYEYVLVYVDDIFCVSPDTALTMSQIQENFKFKNNEIKPERITCWNMSSAKYVNVAIASVQETLAARNTSLATKCYAPLRVGYRPEGDVSPMLNQDDTTYYQELIGVLRWAIELG
jgi:hypothetical protein